MLSPTRLLAVIFTLSGSAWAAGAPVTCIPVDNPVAIEHGWQKECDDRIAAAQGKPVDLMFIGDSVTQNFVEVPKNGWNLVGAAVWAKYYGTKNALNLGVGSDGTQHILWRLDHENIKSFKPKVIVLMAGLNDMQYPPADIAAGIKAILEKCRSIFPDAKFVLMGITPSNRGIPTTLAANKIIASYADGQSVVFLDLVPKMPPVGDNFKGVGGDHTHLTAEGYEIWASSLAPILEDLMRFSRF